MDGSVKVPPTCVQYVCCLIYPGSVIVQLVDFTHEFPWRVTTLYLDSCIRCSRDVLFRRCTVALSNRSTRFVSVDDASDKTNVWLDRLDIFIGKLLSEWERGSKGN
jgi:hypothetical protein